MDKDAKQFLNELKSLKEEINQPAMQQQNISQPQTTQLINENTIKENDFNDTEETFDTVDLALDALSEDIFEKTTVYLPALKKSVIVTPLNSIDELTLDTNRLNVADFVHLLNGLILKHIEHDGSEPFKSLKKFEKHILPVDKNLLLQALLTISFEKLTEFPMVCENCQKEFIADVLVENTSVKFDMNAKQLQKIDFYNLVFTQKLLNSKLELDIGFNPEWVKIHLLKLQSVEETKENLQKKSLFSVFTNLIQYIKEARVYNKEGQLVVKFAPTNKVNLQKLIKFFEKMPVKVKEILLEHVDLSVLDPYLPEFNLKVVCPYCHHSHTLPYQPETEFFRKALYYSS
jgi:hypothetical protein